MRRADLAYLAGLTAVWVLLWGDLSVANVVTGAVAAGMLLLVFPLEHDIEHVRHRFRPLGALRLGLAFAWELVASSVVMISHILGGSSRERPGVVACPLRVGAPGLVTFLTNMIAMSPGTMPIDVDEDPPVLYVHVLRLQDPEAIRARVARFERLAVLALGNAEAVAAVSVPPPPPPHLAKEQQP